MNLFTKNQGNNIPGTPTMLGESTFAPGMKSEMAHQTAIRLGTYLSLLSNEQLPISPGITSATVQAVLTNFRQENPSLTSRGFWVAYMLEEFRQSIPLGLQSETLLGDAGPWKYGVPLEMNSPDKSERILLGLKLRESLGGYFEENQKALPDLYKFIVEKERIEGREVPFEFDKRFKDEKTIEYWMDLLSRYRHPIDGKEYKDLEIEFDNTTGTLKQKTLDTVANLEILEGDKNKKSLVGIKYVTRREMKEINENEKRKVSIVSNKGVREEEVECHKIEQGKIANIYLIMDAKNGLSGCEVYFNHLHFNEEQGWEMFNKYIAPLLLPYESKKFENKHQIIRAKGFKDNGKEWTQYTTEETFEMGDGTTRMIYNALASLDKLGYKLPLSVLLNMAWNINHPENTSTAICVQAKESAGLQMSVIPRIANLITLFQEFKKNNSNPEHLGKLKAILPAFRFIKEDIDFGKKGKPLGAVLFSHIDKITQKFLANLQPLGNNMMKKSGAQTSSVSHEDSVLSNVTFTSANNSSTDTTYGRMSLKKSPNDTARARYSITFESTLEEFLFAQRKSNLQTISVESSIKDSIKDSILKESTKKLFENQRTLIQLCYMISFLEIKSRNYLQEQDRGQDIINLFENYKQAQKEVNSILPENRP